MPTVLTILIYSKILEVKATPLVAFTRNDPYSYDILSQVSAKFATKNGTEHFEI